MTKRLIREHKAGFKFKTGECPADLKWKKGLHWLKLAAAAGIVLAALGFVPCGKAGVSLAEESGALLRVQATEISDREISDGEASEEEIFGQLDTFTGEKLEEGPDGSFESAGQTDKIWITDIMFYDTENKAYGYTAGDEVVYANVADGMIVEGKVSVVVPETVTARLYWNGNAMNFPGGNISRLGSYTVEIQNDASTTQLFSFLIVGDNTNQVVNYTMPEGFHITMATLNGTEIEYSRNYVDMAKEGRYVISYECSRAELSYTLNVNVDTTPPTLVIEGVDEDGKARGPVAITGKVDQDTLVVTRNGEEYNTTLSRVLTQSGRYVVTVTDPAGNSTTYQFTIMIYLDRYAWIFSALFLVVVVAVTGLFIYFRTHLRVR